MNYRGKFDLALSAKTSPMKLVNLFLYWLGAKERIAYVDSSWHRILINRPLPFDARKSKTLHQALKGLHMVAPELKEIPEELYPRLQIPDGFREKYRTCVTLKSPIVLVTASTTRPSSRFDVDRYVAILNSLYADYAFSVLVIGQSEDEKRARELVDKMKAPHQIHFPRNFDEFMVLLDLSDLYFVGDGGVAHIGAALGKREVVLYGETDPIEWHPLSKNVETFYHPHHVDQLSDSAIFHALRGKLEEVICGRNDL